MRSQIDFRNPIDWTHPDTAGLQFALLNIPGLTGGGRWPDASQRTNGGTLTATASSGESVDTGAGFPWLVAGLGYW